MPCSGRQRTSERACWRSGSGGGQSGPACIPRCEDRALTSDGDQEPDLTVASFATLPPGIGASSRIVTVRNAAVLKPVEFLDAGRTAGFLFRSLQGHLQGQSRSSSREGTMQIELVVFNMHGRLHDP